MLSYLLTKSFFGDLARLITVQLELLSKLDSLKGKLESLRLCRGVPHRIHFFLSVGLIKLQKVQCHCRTDAIAPMVYGTWLKDPLMYQLIS